MLIGWIISDTKPGEGYFSAEDLSNLQKLPFKLEFINMAGIDLEVAADQLTRIHVHGEYRSLPDFALCMFEQEVSYFHFALLRQLEMLGVFSLHKAKNIAGSLDKLHTYQKLLRAGIPVAKTILVNAHSRLDWIIERIGFPMVLKVPDGSKGEGVCLVNNRPELQNIHDLFCRNSGRDLLAQEFIATSKGRDARITLCDGEVVFGVLRDNSAGEDFRSNISVGGNGAWWEPDEEAIKIAKESVKVMDMKLCGVDLLFGENGYIVGEINSMPGCLHVMYQGKSNLQRLLEAIYRVVVKNVGHGR